MNYFEAFEKLKQASEKAKLEKTDGHLAIQVVILDDEASGIFYIEDFGDKILAEPYDYYDNDAEIQGQYKDLIRLFEKKLELSKAIEDNIITASGNIEALYSFFDRIKIPAKKASTKKTTVKNTASTKKTTKKKTEANKMTKDSKNKVSKPKDTETIKEVVEKEVKPKK